MPQLICKAVLPVSGDNQSSYLVVPGVGTNKGCSGSNNLFEAALLDTPYFNHQTLELIPNSLVVTSDYDQWIQPIESHGR